MIIEKVTNALIEYRLSEAGEALYSYVWDDYCDWYLELSKGNANTAVLVHTLRKILQLLHPYCPFVTEELWSHIKPNDEGMLIAKSWPVLKKERIDTEVETQFLSLIGVIQEIRKIRSEQNVEVGKGITVTIVTKDSTALESQQEHIKRMGKVESLTFETKANKPKNVASAFLPGIEVHVSLAGLFDPAKERASLTKEKENLEKFVKGIEAKLGNEQFVAKAPVALIEEQKAKLSEAKAKLEKIEERLKGL